MKNLVINILIPKYAEANLIATNRINFYSEYSDQLLISTHNIYWNLEINVFSQELYTEASWSLGTKVFKVDMVVLSRLRGFEEPGAMSAIIFILCF